jgi:hypothetical protein
MILLTKKLKSEWIFYAFGLSIVDNLSKKMGKGPSDMKTPCVLLKKRKDVASSFT